MDDDLHASTSTVLLQRLRTTPTDESAWNQFVRIYAPAIRRWCRAWRLQPADADDVTQTVLAKLARKVRTFRYDRTKSFRAYLKALTRYAICDALEAFRREGQWSGAPEVLEWLEIADTRDDLARCLETEFRQRLFLEASAQIMRRIDTRTWEAFRLLTQEYRPVQDVAEQLEMTVAAVYMAKSRVLKMLREEIREMSQMLS